MSKYTLFEPNRCKCINPENLEHVYTVWCVAPKWLSLYMTNKSIRKIINEFRNATFKTPKTNRWMEIVLHCSKLKTMCFGVSHAMIHLNLSSKVYVFWGGNFEKILNIEPEKPKKNVPNFMLRDGWATPQATLLCSLLQREGEKKKRPREP